jgi:hypothetical protein
VLFGAYAVTPGAVARAEPTRERRQAPACLAESPDEASALLAAKACGGDVPIAAQTSEYDQGVAEPAGTVRWEHRYRPVRVKRDAGWTPVDTTLVVGADGFVRPVAAAADLVFSGGGSGAMVSIAEDGARLQLGSPVGNLPEPVLHGNVATYPEVLPGVDLQLKADVDGYDQVLVVKNREAAANPELAKLRFPLTTDGADVSADAAGNLRATGADGKLELVGNTPTMWDAPKKANVKAMATTVSKAAVTVVPDQKMLADPATVYPVYIDPGVTAARSNWAMVDSAYPSQVYWNSTGEAISGTTDGGTNKYRAFFDLDVGSTPIAGKYIVSAKFIIPETYTWGCQPRPVELWSTTYAGSSTTWNAQPTWSALQSTVTAAKGSTLCPAGTLSFSTTNIVQAAANGAWSDVTLGLKSPNETDSTYLKRFSNNPTLQISYAPYEPAAGCPGGTAVNGDYNGDGVVDTVLGAAKTVVNGLGNAGSVQVVDGATGATRTLVEGAGGVPDTPAANDEFGKSVATLDANDDGCSDLVVGAPFEDSGTLADTGKAFLIFGSGSGLGGGPASIVLEQGRALEQGRGTVPDTPEGGDWFGFSLAAGTTAAGEPFLLVGAPGEDIGSASDVGKVHYLRGSTNIAFDESQVGAGALENDDRFGYALAATAYQFAISQPGEAIGANVFAGSVCAYSHTITSSLPGLIKCAYQGAAGISGETAEPGDQFGKSIAMVPYRPVGAAAGVADSLLVIGVPGEDVGSAVDTGRVQEFLVTATGLTEIVELTENTAGIGGDDQSGDYFGERVVAANLNPAAEASASTVLVAVGSPGEDQGALDAGEVHVFAGGATTIASDVELYRRDGGLPLSPIKQDLLGAFLGSNGQSLLVGSPFGAQAVYAYPWSSLAAGAKAPGTTYPGTGLGSALG